MTIYITNCQDTVGRAANLPPWG